MKNNKKEEGTGHQARIAAELKATVEVNGEKQTYNVNYDLTVTVEQIDYAVRQLAGTIARVASKVAEESNGVAAERAERTGAAVG